MAAAPNPMRARILDAALRATAAHGLGRLSLEDVAREAGVSRQTLYRYFAGRDALIAAVLLREEEAFLDAVRAAADAHTDLRPAVEAAIAAALRAARGHPLLDRLLATEPEALLPVLLTDRGPVLGAARPAIEALLSERLPNLPAATIARAADATARLLTSYAVNPPEDDVDDVAAGLADLILFGLHKEPQ